VKSVDATVEIINQVRELEGATVTELAECVDLSQASVHAHLKTLEGAGFIVQDGHRYDIGPELFTLGEYVRNHSELYQASKDEVEKLTEETEESAHLSIEHGGQLVFFYERYGAEAVGTDYHDNKREKPHTALHCTAVGKAILGELPREKLESILEDRGLPEYTPKTITDRETLQEELEEYRRRGYGTADEEMMHGIRAVGAAIQGSHGEVAGATAVAGPTTRLRDDASRASFPRW